MRIEIYQIAPSRDEKRVKFLGLDSLLKLTGSPRVDPDIYEKVFDGNVAAGGLEEVYQIFNGVLGVRPSYAGHSLSVSDVVHVIRAKDVEPGFYFCDDIGFAEIPFTKEAEA